MIFGKMSVMYLFIITIYSNCTLASGWDIHDESKFQILAPFFWHVYIICVSMLQAAEFIRDTWKRDNVIFVLLYDDNIRRCFLKGYIISI